MVGSRLASVLAAVFPAVRPLEPSSTGYVSGAGSDPAFSHHNLGQRSGVEPAFIGLLSENWG